MLRSIILVIAAILYLILTLPVLLIISLIGIRNPDLRDRIAAAMIRWIFRVLLALAGTKIHVAGQERIPHDTPVLYIGNHRSIFDIVATYNYVYGNTGYVAKKTLGRIPVFRFWEKYIGCLFLDRSNPKSGMQMIRSSIERIKSGHSIFIFPEGTRSKQENDYPTLDFHEGSFRIATSAGCPIVPVSINHTADIFEKHMPFVRSAHITIEFGEPIPTKGISRVEKKALGASIQTIINETLKKNYEK
ncbi:MAG: lysophospholipid acyltransferase family protein [Bacillota bacterium]|jgi:1-acyl-sn-glycerol-3-phosphate acyltransferase